MNLDNQLSDILSQSKNLDDDDLALQTIVDEIDKMQVNLKTQRPEEEEEVKLDTDDTTIQGSEVS